MTALLFFVCGLCIPFIVYLKKKKKKKKILYVTAGLLNLT